MIYGIGNDITDIRRIEKTFLKHGKRFLGRCFTALEAEIFNQKYDLNHKNAYAYLAKRFAAKEACSKALGTGFSGGISMIDFEISNDEYGKPAVLVSGKAKQILNQLLSLEQKYNIHLSISDEFPYCSAYVIIEFN